MDVKDPSASVRHPLSGVAPSDTHAADAAADERAQRSDYGDGDERTRPKDIVEPPLKDIIEQRPKDIIGPTDFTETKRPPRDFIDIREPDIIDFTDAVDVRDFKDVVDIKDFVDVKDFKDVTDIVDFKDIGDVRDIRDFKDRVDFKDIIEQRPKQR